MKRQNLFLFISIGLLFSSIFTISYADASRWKCILEDKDVRCIAANPIKPAVYVGTSAEGIYKTEDRGESWIQLNNGFDRFPWIYSIVVYPKNPDIMYVGSDGGIYKSTNGGIDWKKIKSSISIFVVAIDPNDSQIIYTGNFKSKNGGKRWEKMAIQEMFRGNIYSIAINPKNTKVIYGCCLIGGLLKSTDSGETWELIHKHSYDQVAIDAVDTETVYTGGMNGVYKSIDAGKNWELMNNGLPEGLVTSVLIDPIDHRIIYAGVNGVGVFFSQDSGVTWEQLGKGFPVIGIIYELAINPSEPNILYAATTDGLWGLELEPRESHSIQPLGKLFTTWGYIKDF